ncbi:hypothetical protein [Terrabacter sp. Ter38]|nr:hypothetical protein [Terrabacter sp. Ter38]
MRSPQVVLLVGREDDVLEDDVLEVGRPERRRPSAPEPVRT